MLVLVYSIMIQLYIQFIHTHTHTHAFFLMFFPIVVYQRIINTVPCKYRGLRYIVYLFHI